MIFLNIYIYIYCDCKVIIAIWITVIHVKYQLHVYGLYIYISTIDEITATHSLYRYGQQSPTVTDKIGMDNGCKLYNPEVHYIIK